jgi:hypothetical protein
MEVDDFLSTLANDLPPVLEWDDLTEDHLEDWLDHQIDHLKLCTPMTEAWEKDIKKIWTRLDIKQIGKDNIMPTVLAFRKCAKTHRMEDLLDTSRHYQKIQYNTFLESITPKSAAKYIQMETEKSTLAGEGHKQWHTWLRDVCITKF